MEIGTKINSLTFVKEGERKPKIGKKSKTRRMAVVKCDCGNISTKDYYAFKSGHTKSCKNCAIGRRNEAKKKHRLIKHPLYRKWSDMKKRCYNPNVDRYPNYGALGIRVCPEWKDDFKSFYDWSIANGWKEGLTIERADNYKDYCPENCKYITEREQAYNKKNTRYIDYNGESYCVAKLLTDWGVPPLDRFKYYHKLNDGKTIYEIETIVKQLYAAKT